MSPTREPSDQQLESMLRDIEVPTELKSQLRSIPARELSDWNECSEESELDINNTRSQDSAWKAHRGWLMMAAAIFGLSAFLVWQLVSSDSDPLNADGSIIAHHGARLGSPGDAGPHDTQLQLAEVRKLQAEIDLAWQEIEIGHLKHRLTSLTSPEKQPDLGSLGSLNSLEIDSMIIAIADQTAINLGGDKERVARDMMKVISRYPNTAGARIAQKFLDQQSN